jgi:hypothetical protein
VQFRISIRFPSYPPEKNKSITKEKSLQASLHFLPDTVHLLKKYTAGFSLLPLIFYACPKPWLRWPKAAFPARPGQ